MLRLSLGKGLAVAATAFVLIAVLFALSVIEGPGTLRDRRLDNRRAQDLNDIANALNCYWTLNGETELPADLQSLDRYMDSAFRDRALPSLCRMPLIEDAETGEPYGYRVLDGAEFELCATFARATDADTPTVARPHKPYGQRLWQHESGKHCFTLKAEKVKLPGMEQE